MLHRGKGWIDARGASARREPSKRHDAALGLAGDHRLRDQPCAGIEQRLSAPDDGGAALDILEGHEACERGMGKDAPDIAGGQWPACRIGRESGIGSVAEEGRNRDVGKADVAEQEAIGG